jgi:predicted GH43/DUF377 family glycosyl hydrolase
MNGNERKCSRLFALICGPIWLAGCARYSDFTLPAPPAGPPVEFRWEIREGPVVPRGDPGAWDASDVLNPSVIRHVGEYLNLYSGFDGKTWHTGIASSTDGLTWSKQGLILSPDPSTWEGGYIAANGSALAWRGEIWYWYQAGSPPRIGLARSSDARQWRKEPAPVLDLGPRGSWDERGLGDPYVIEAGGRLYMFYLGMDRARRQRLGVSRSDDGLHWTKLRSNPILELGDPGAFDENGLGEPAVWSGNSRYWMLYTGRDRGELRRIGLAESRDGVRWVRSDRAQVLSGNQPWDSKVVCDPSVEPAEQGIRVWFGGGDVARPDERINGQIGYGFLRPVPIATH